MDNRLSKVDSLSCVELSDEESVVNGFSDDDPPSGVQLSDEDSVDNGLSEVLSNDSDDKSSFMASVNDSVGKGLSELALFSWVELSGADSAEKLCELKSISVDDSVEKGLFDLKIRSSKKSSVDEVLSELEILACVELSAADSVGDELSVTLVDDSGLIEIKGISELVDDFVGNGFSKPKLPTKENSVDKAFSVFFDLAGYDKNFVKNNFFELELVFCVEMSGSDPIDEFCELKSISI